MSHVSTVLGKALSIWGLPRVLQTTSSDKALRKSQIEVTTRASIQALLVSYDNI